MPGKARNARPGSAVSDGEDTFPLLSLPAAVLSHIAAFGFRVSNSSRGGYHCSEPQGGHPLLGVSRACRDAVLHATKTISLLASRSPADADASAAQTSADARLLHRVCCEASPGLEVRLCMGCREPDTLSISLQPGISSGGWAKVHTLRVDARQGQACVHVIPLACPALCELSLGSAELGDGALFDMFACQASCILRNLELMGCSISTSAVGHAARSLARLPHLQSLALRGPNVPVRIAAQLTGLTSLIIRDSTDADAEQMLRVAGQNTGLVQLKYNTSVVPSPYMASQQFTLLSNCTSLMHLNMAAFHIDDQALDVLLTHCTSITDLTLGSITLDSSRADRQCSWRKLSLLGPPGDILLYLPYLPLTSVQELWNLYNILSGVLPLPPPDAVPAAQLPSLLHQAATNLATCPAWISAAPSKLTLQGAGQELTADQQVQLFQALAPLGGPHVTEIEVCLEGQLELGSAEVQALASSIGGSLQKLRLYRCTLLSTFWKALAHHFPQLSSLDLPGGIQAGVGDITMYLAMRSSSSPQPMRLDISPEVLHEESQKWLEEVFGAWQLPNVTLEFW